MKVDSTLTARIAETTQVARALEGRGFDGLWAAETKHEPFLQLLRAADATERITVGSAIVVAFARSPMTVASAGFDLAEYTCGRFVLGLGSQIKPHIERRFSMPWSRPAARMREYVLAMRAIWGSWQHGEGLDFRGEFYTHTLMTPFFSPHPHVYGPPPVLLAAVGERMTEVAGEVCEGILLHAFTTRRYLEEVTLPAVARGRATAGLPGRDGFTVAGMNMVCTGRDEAELEEARQKTREQIAFYASTPAYRAVLDLHGWGDLQPELNRLSKEGRWTEMANAIDDEVLHEFATVGEPASVGRDLAHRWGSLLDRSTLYCSSEVATEALDDIVSAVRAD
jgi:probable F420-dependent oxidoreductase